MTVPSAAPKLLPHLWKSTLVSGILALILGAVMLARPGESVLAAAILFGIYLLVTGVAQVIFAFSLPVLSAGGRVLLFISGAASLILAVLCFRHFNADREELAVVLLAIWIGIGFIFRGVAITTAAIGEPNLPGRGWQIFMGVITLLAGIVTLASPLASLWILALVVGSCLVVLGVVEIVAAVRIRGASRRIATALAGR